MNNTTDASARLENDRMDCRRVRPPVFFGAEEEVFEVAWHEPAPGATPPVPEDLVQDIWERQAFDRRQLETVDGREIVVVHPGKKNSDAGPDFSHAVLHIDGMEWVGDVEIHVESGRWNDHGHITDARYNSVILHVALRSDMWTGSLKRPDGSTIPEVILYPRLNVAVRSLIHDFHTRRDAEIICAAQWRQVPQAVRTPWFEQLSYRRLVRKAMQDAPPSTPFLDDDQALYEAVFAALGYAKNDEPMRELAYRIPLRFVRSELKPDDLEACFFGVAGLLPTPADLLDADRETADYAMQLREQYERIQLRHDLTSMPREAWKFFRLRPANFPPLRIAQGVILLRRLLCDRPLDRLRAACTSQQPLQDLRRCFYIKLPPFWTRHVRLEKKSRTVATEIGSQRIDVILANAVLPALFRIANRESDSPLEEAVLATQSRLPAENDEVVAIFRRLGSPPMSAQDAQALHELYGGYCTRARCLSCEIGRYLLHE